MGIQKKSVTSCESPFLFDKGSMISWTPNTDKLTVSDPGVVMKSYDDEWFGQPVSVIEMDGKVDVLDEMIYVESAMCSTGTKYCGCTPKSYIKRRQMHPGPSDW